MLYFLNFEQKNEMLRDPLASSVKALDANQNLYERCYENKYYKDINKYKNMMNGDVIQ